MNLPWIERPQLRVAMEKPLSHRWEIFSDAMLEGARELSEEIRADIPASLRFVANVVRVRTLNRFQNEMCSLAQALEIDWRDLALANVSYDLVVNFGCSTLALATGEGPVLARNMDWFPADLIARNSYVLDYYYHDQHRFSQANCPGGIGVITGMSTQGFALALNAVSCEEGLNRWGYPVLLHLRRVLEDARNFEEALRMLTEAKLASAALITLIGKENKERVCVERTPTQAVQRWPEGNDPLVTTNHYQLLSEDTSNIESLASSSCPRLDSLSDTYCRFAEKAPSDAQLLYSLTDPSVMQEITAQHILCKPRENYFKLFVPAKFMQESEKEETAGI
ncbi:Hypothetical protein PBC10988_35550 [Planctomycetales bacterium 10988]|nr:Hypothetical protein PBC10988_35550 [Planctomycetales bacterium 10988]